MEKITAEKLYSHLLESATLLTEKKEGTLKSRQAISILQVLSVELTQIVNKVIELSEKINKYEKN